MSIKANIAIDQGSDFRAEIELITKVNDVDEPVNLIGSLVYAQMRKNHASNTAIDFVATHSGNTGIVTLSLDSANTSVIDPGRYFYDVEIKDTQDRITRIVEGIVTVSPGITRTI